MTNENDDQMATTFTACGSGQTSVGIPTGTESRYETLRVISDLSLVAMELRKNMSTPDRDVLLDLIYLKIKKYVEQL